MHHACAMTSDKVIRSDESGFNIPLNKAVDTVSDERLFSMLYSLSASPPIRFQGGSWNISPRTKRTYSRLDLEGSSHGVSVQ